MVMPICRVQFFSGNVVDICSKQVREGNLKTVTWTDMAGSKRQAKVRYPLT